MKRTKILCTLGPASRSPDVLRRMAKAGMNAVRVNTAYGSLEDHARMVEHARSAADVPVMFDIKGPEVRLRCRSGVEVGRNGTVEVGFRGTDPVSFNREFYGQLRVGDVVVLGKGAVTSKVLGKSGGRVKLRLSSRCTLRDGMGVNIPGRRLDLPTLSRRDLQAIRLARELDVEYIALSFTRDAKDVANLRRRLGGSGIGVIAKMENREGVGNIDSILRGCDGIMVARGDLGVELPPEEIPLMQKELIAKCNRMGKISIVATEMLQSMVENPYPTRAETSDVANAILDGADAVMLSAESAVGRHPVEAVKAMSRIAVEVECHLPITPLDEEVHDPISLAISKAVTSIIGTVNVDKIVVATRTGYTAMLISNFRVCKDIIAITDDPKVRRKLHLVYAVQPVEHEYFREKDKVRDIARYCLREGLVKKGDTVLFTAGVYTRKPTTNLVQVHNVGELLECSR